MSTPLQNSQIFESPDKGTTVFVRYHGSTERMRINSNGDIGIGADIKSYEEFLEILKMSQTNPAVKTALEKLKTTYYLSKYHGS